MPHRDLPRPARPSCRRSPSRTAALAASAAARQIPLALTALAILLIAAAGIARATEIRHPSAVVELFTSQGCSSCPPADKVFRELASRPEILGLAFHVDYWNGLGWRDTFSSAEHTRRQWAYAGALGERQVYTPQAIVNGRSHHVGARKQRIEERIEAYEKSGEGMTVPISVTEENGVLTVEIPENPGAAQATLYALYFQPEASVEVKRGENRGRTLEYTNIVHKVEMIGMAGADGMRAEFLVSDLRGKGQEGCAFILQGKREGGHPGPILGAVSITGL